MEINQQELYKFIGNTEARLESMEKSIQNMGRRIGDLESSNHHTEKSWLNGKAKPIIITSGTISALSGIVSYLLTHLRG